MNSHLFTVTQMIEIQATSEDAARLVIEQQIEKSRKKMSILESNIDYISNSNDDKLIYIGYHDGCEFSSPHKHEGS